jgi:predicted MFS family arabinose efflux permease
VTEGSLLRLPGVPAQAAFGLVAQVTQQVGGMGSVLVVAEATGSLAQGGLAAAAVAIGVGMGRPVHGRIIDRRGARAVLAFTACVHGAALGGLVLLAVSGAPGWALILLAWVAGAGLPPVSLGMRVEWGALAGDERRTAAYSLVFMVQQLAIVLGPLTFGALVGAASASAALGCVAAMAAAGTIGLSRVLHANPPGSAGGARRGVLRRPGMPAVLGIALLLSGAIGALEVGLPALASAHGVPGASGVLLAVNSLGGIAGAAAYAARRWSAPPVTRMIWLMIWLGAALALAAALGPLPAVGAVLFAAGFALTPALTTTSLLADEVAPESRAEAFGWIATAFGVGIAAGAAVAGIVADRLGPSAVFLLAAAFPFLAAGLARLAIHRSDDFPVTRS